MYSQGPRAVFPQIKYKIELARDESVGATDESNEGIGANLCMLNLMRRPTPPTHAAPFHSAYAASFHPRKFRTKNFRQHGQMKSRDGKSQRREEKRREEERD